MKNAYVIIILISLIYGLTRMLFLEYLSDTRELKIGVEITLASIIALTIAISAPKSKLLKYILWNSLILFLILQYSNWIVYLVIGQPKYLENTSATILLGILMSSLAATSLSLIGNEIKKRLPTIAKKTWGDTN